jgi:cobalt/nickel transport protein
MSGRVGRRFVWIGLLSAVGVALILSPFASQSPDGLERIAEDHGFIGLGQQAPAVEAPLPDYSVPGIGGGWLSTSAAGVAGTLLTFGLAYGVGRWLSKRRAGQHDR